MLGARDFYLDISSWLSGIHGSYHEMYMRLQGWPLWVTDNDDGYSPLLQILLVTQVLIGGDEDSKPFVFGGGQ